MMGHRESLKTAEEYDCVHKWARYRYCYMNNTSAARKIKKQMTRRNRRQYRQSLRAEVAA